MLALHSFSWPSNILLFSSSIHRLGTQRGSPFVYDGHAAAIIHMQGVCGYIHAFLLDAPQGEHAGLGGSPTFSLLRSCQTVF